MGFPPSSTRASLELLLPFGLIRKARLDILVHDDTVTSDCCREAPLTIDLPETHELRGGAIQGAKGQLEVERVMSVETGPAGQGAEVAERDRAVFKHSEVRLIR